MLRFVLIPPSPFIMHADEVDPSQAAPKPQTAARSAYDDVLYGSDTDSGSDNDERATVTQNRKTQSKKNKAKGEGAFIHEDDEEVLDLLDDRMMSRISGQSSFAFVLLGEGS